MRPGRVASRRDPRVRSTDREAYSARMRHAAVVLAILLVAGTPAHGLQTLEDATATPEATAELYLRSLRAIRWDVLARLMHEEPLARFHEVVRMMVAVDTTGDVREYLTGEDSAGFAALPPDEVFHRAIGRMVDDMPGLMHAIYDHDDEVLGHVMEGTDTAHVVYRTTPRISGGVPEVLVLQLVRTPAGWRVLWSDDLEVLDTALRGVLRGRRPPGG